MLTKERDKTRLDNINLLYVAFTRASEVLQAMVAQRSGETYIGRFIKRTLSQMPNWNPTLGEYKRGARVLGQAKLAVDEQSVDLQDFISVDWKNKMTIHLQAPEYWDLENISDEKEFGNALHKVLADITYKEDKDLAIEQHKRKGTYDENWQERISMQIQTVLNHKLVGKYFSQPYQVKNEWSLINQNGLILRPDRVVENNDEVVILDYKTGKEDPEHKIQINKYKNIISEISTKNIKAYLVYTQSAHVVQV